MGTQYRRPPRPTTIVRTSSRGRGAARSTLMQKITQNLVTADEAMRRAAAEFEAEDAAPATVAPVDSKREQPGRAFAWLAILTPKRIWNEDVGDAIETIYAMERAGSSWSNIRVKIISTYF